jgi:tRNA modification GTPase
VSGAEALAVVLPLLYNSGRPELAESAVPPSHLLVLRHIIEPGTQEVLDEALVVYMRAPRTYTAEDVVEIQCHGGPLILRRILQAVLAQGARLANPGEFTMRAFLNGRMDLAQAEAVMDLIGAETEAGQRLAMQQLRGRLSDQVQEARHSILYVVARIEASIDFPEDDIPTPTADELEPSLKIAQSQITALLAGSEQGRLYKQGLRTAIIGRPNVGKSSLLNALLRMERAIVTPVAGTTRDTVEEIANVQGIPLHLIDTAGITPTDDPVERIGVQRSRAAAESAELILLVFDGSEPLTEQDKQVSRELQEMGFGSISDREALYKRPVIVVVNKIDREKRIDEGELRKMWPGAILLGTSTVSDIGLDELEQAVVELVLGGKVVTSESVLVTSARHQEALRRAGEHVRAAQKSLGVGLPLDFVSIDLRAAYDALGEVTGETASDDLLDKIFSEFCIGK